MHKLQNPLVLSSTNPSGFWESALNSLSRELSPQQFKTWISPLTLVAHDEGDHSLTIGAPNRFKLDWTKKTFADRLQELASQHFNRPMTIHFVLAVEGGGVENPNPTVMVKQAPAPLDHAGGPKTEERVLVEEQSFEIEDHSKLNPNLTFETFVTGKANQLARAASIQVAHNPGTSYNPMFLYGGVGLGKTHLIHAIGNHLLKERPGARIRYIHAEQYVSDVVRAYQQKAFDRFKRYYHSLDLLLIDDIQFFSGKSRTQEEFFYAFEALLSNKAQVIITSDTYPKEMAGIDDRLISRFDSGLTVAIEPPELEMRVAILMKKALSEGIPMSEDVAFFVAKHLRSNVRELEGALRKILAYVRFHDREVTIEVARVALKDLLSIQNRQISVENIQKAVADFYSIKVADMYSKRRPANIARPRQIAMFMAKELTQKSLPEIGELFGGRDHTTVLHAVRKIGEERALDGQLNHEIHVIEQTLKA
ncbi:chromosomal replication initiator protein DnaA [Polynucleobacter meluiroseus]|nr:chromosomal replication initiator protein DnaA [Polynucleobacter meluiroseus]